MAVSSLLAPLSVLDERLSRANARSRSLALNALNRPLHHRPTVSSRLPSVHSSHKQPQRAPALNQARAVNTLTAINTVINSNGGAAGGARKAKYGVNALKDDIIEAKELQREDVVVEGENDVITAVEPVKEVQPINLLDVAVTKPLKGKQALLAEYEMIHKPSVIVLDESVGDLLDEDWEKVDSEGEVEDEVKKQYRAGWPALAGEK